MDILVVNDTNIFIDLISVDLLDDFFNLPIGVHTTDLVLNELTDESQSAAVRKHIKLKHLTVKRYSWTEVAEIVSFRATCHKNVSIADCSVWLYAKHNGYTLLTGDAKLRSSAQKSGVTVCGILGLFVRIFDMLVEDFKIIPPEVGAERLELLNKINNRLPSREIETRIKKWRFF